MPRYIYFMQSIWSDESYSLIFNGVVYISVWYLKVLRARPESKEQLKPHRLTNEMYSCSSPNGLAATHNALQVIQSELER